jgi:hypothetical protein
VGAHQLLGHQQEMTEAALIADELAQRMGKVGNWGEDRVIAVALQAKAEQLRLIQREEQAQTARQALSTLVGTQAFELPDRLPQIGGLGSRTDMKTAAQDLALERLNRLPDYASRVASLAQREAAAGTQALEQWQTYARERIDAVIDGASVSALTVDRSVVLWTHDIKEALHERQALVSLEQQTQATIARAQFDVRAKHAQAMLLSNELVPLAIQAEEQGVYQYNGMFISTWALLDLFRARVTAQMASLQAQMQYWDSNYAFQAYLAGGPYKTPVGDGADEMLGGAKAGGGH